MQTVMRRICRVADSTLMKVAKMGSRVSPESRCSSLAKEATEAAHDALASPTN